MRVSTNTSGSSEDLSMSLAFVAKVSCHEAATPSRDAGPLPFNIGDGMHRRVVNDFESPAANKANRGFVKGFFLV